MKIICSIILLFIGSNSFSQKKKTLLQEIQSDSIDYKLDSILIVGIGSSATSVFLDYVSECFIKELNPKKVNTTYVYLGKDPEPAKKAFDTVNKSGYKAILLITQSGASSFNIANKLRTFELVPSFQDPTNHSIVKTKMQYEQDFNLQLYLPNQNMKKIWKASAAINCDPSETKTPKKLVKEIVQNFTSHRYI